MNVANYRRDFDTHVKNLRKARVSFTVCLASFPVISEQLSMSHLILMIRLGLIFSHSTVYYPLLKNLVDFQYDDIDIRRF